MVYGHGVVLVVDDDLAVRESLKFLLELEGLEVLTFASGSDLFLYSELSEAVCLVLDYKMPFMDGFKVLERLARNKLNLPVILITSHVTDAFRRRAAAAGAKIVLEKPLLDNALLDQIQGILRLAPHI